MKTLCCSRRHWVGFVLTAATPLSALASEQPESAGSLSPDERAALAAGVLVKRPLRLERGDQQLIGGMSYQRVLVPPPLLLGELTQPDNLPEMLPFTLAARQLAGTATDALVEIEQGRAPFTGRYTVRAQRQDDRLRFWLDKQRPAPFRDLWGYFRVQPFQERYSLLTVAVLLDLGPGLMRLMFEEKIQRIALRTPQKIRDFVEPMIVAQR